MRTPILAPLLWIVIAALVACSRAPERVKTPRYTIEQFYRSVSASGGSFSHDNRTLLYTNDSSGVFNAYTVPVAGGDSTPLTRSKETTFAVSFFPNDNRALLRRDRGGNEIYHIYLRGEDGAERDLTPGEMNRALFLTWAHGLDRFYYLSNKRDPRYMDLYEMDIADFKPKLVYRNTEGYSVQAISNDGRYLALAKERTDHDNDIYLLDLRGGRRTHLSPHEGDVRYRVVDFTPDTRAIYYLTDAGSEFRYLAKMTLANRKSEVIEKPDWDVMYAGLSWNGKYLSTAVNDDARTVVKIYEAASMQPVALPAPPRGEITSISFSRDEKLMRFYLSSPRSSPDLYVYDLEAGRYTRLTHTMNPEIDPDQLAGVEVVRYRSFDGVEIPALLMRPPGAAGEKTPGIVEVHGGPGGQTRVGYNPLFQYLVNHGYTILMVNNRGSSGYGKTFYGLDDHRHGQDDLQDCVKGKEYLVSSGLVDQNRIAILGGSYGGYMVLAALAFQPDAFDAGVDLFGVANWVRTLKSIPPWWTDAREALYKELGDPRTEEDYLRKISPLFHAGNIRKPLLVLQGANDPRVLKVESDEIVAKVKANGVPVEYIVFDDEGHGFTKKANRMRGYKAVREFLDQYVKGETGG